LGKLDAAAFDSRNQKKASRAAQRQLAVDAGHRTASGKSDLEKVVLNEDRVRAAKLTPADVRRHESLEKK
jgi:hypothetical protein